MITIDDMKKAVVAALNENFGYPCYEFGVVEQMEYPCFFVRITENGELYTKNRYQQRYAVEIVLMHERGEHGQEIKVLKDIEKIKQIFLFAMQTEKKKVPIMNFEMECTANERIRNEGGLKRWECQALTLYSENLQRHLNREMTTELLP